MALDSAESKSVVLIVQYVMGFSYLSFIAAWLLRVRNNFLHRILGILGVMLNLLASFWLIYSVHVNQVKIISAYPAYLTLAHRIIATLTAILMLVMLVSGMRRQRVLHVKLHRLFMFSYGLVFISGYILFAR